MVVVSIKIYKHTIENTKLKWMIDSDDMNSIGQEMLDLILILTVNEICRRCRSDEESMVNRRTNCLKIHTNDKGFV